MSHRHLDSEAWAEIRKRRRILVVAFCLIPVVDLLLLVVGHRLQLAEPFRRAVFLTSLAAVIGPFVRFLEVACPGCRRALFRASLDLNLASDRCHDCETALGTSRFGGFGR